MNYTKPAITLVGAAKSAIQGKPKQILAFDAQVEPSVQSTNAYEADE
jgi:hypothetical protein